MRCASEPRALFAGGDAPQASYAAAEAKLLLGNLQLRRGEPDLALEWFERARKELQPLLDKLGDLLGQRGEPTERVRALIEQNLRSFDLAEVSPAPVRERVRPVTWATCSSATRASCSN